MKERTGKKAPRSHAKRVFQALDVNNSVLNVEEKIPNDRERKTAYSDVSICNLNKKITNTVMKKKKF